MSNLAESDRINPEGEYSVTETAAFLGISGRHVRRLADAGDLESRRLTLAPRSPRRISGRSILAFLDARKSRK